MKNSVNYIDSSNSLSSFVSENIRSELGRKRISQNELAKGISISPQQIGARLNGKMLWRIDEIAEVANFLGCSIHKLIFGYEESPAFYQTGLEFGSPNWTRTSNPSINSKRKSEPGLFLLIGKDNQAA